jgi:hypothetical protein
MHDFDAIAPQLRTETRQPGAGSHGVGHHATDHAPVRRAAQRLGDASARGVVREDIGQEMDMMRRGVDIADEPASEPA